MGVEDRKTRVDKDLIYFLLSIIYLLFSNPIFYFSTFAFYHLVLIMCFHLVLIAPPFAKGGASSCRFQREAYGMRESG